MKVILKIFCCCLLFMQAINFSVGTTPCALRETNYGSVCVCNTTYCDYLDEVSPNGPNDFIIISSSKAGLRFASTVAGEFSNSENVPTYTVPDYNRIDQTTSQNFEPSVILNERGISSFISSSIHNIAGYTRTSKIYVDRNKKFQKVEGFGGAFTGSVSHILEQLPETLQDHIYESFFSKTKGIAYNMIRMSIGGCDFDLEPWAYNEFPKNDKKLSNFTKLDQRDEKKIEQLKRLMDVTNNFDIKIMSAAWSPPPWMKTNDDWSGYSHLKKEFYQTWADYHLRYLELMDSKNISIWAISTGNEPLNGIIGWLFVHFMSLGWTPANQAIWISENFGPTIRNSKFRNVKIFSNDDQRYTFPVWFKRMEKINNQSLSYLDGLAVHWYWDQIVGPSVIDQTHELFKDLLLLNTESCVGDKPYETHGPELGSWERAEKYIRSYLQDFQHWFNGWIDWNIVLDERGGPNYVDNFVDAPVIVNVTNRKEIYKQPMFYAIGHFSKFVPEGSIKIHTERTNINIDTVAFLCPDGSISLIFFNSGKAPVEVTISDSIRGNIIVKIPERSVHTIVYK